LLKQRLEFEEEQKRVAERKARFERDQQHQLDMIKAESQKKQEEIQRVLAMNQAMEEKKRSDYYQKVALENQKKAELDKVKKVEDVEKKAQEAAKEQKIKDVIRKNDELLSSRRNDILRKQNSTEQKYQHTQKMLKDQLDNKKNMDHLKLQDRLENIDRIREVQEYKKHKLLEKLDGDSKRVEGLKQGREDVVAMRQKLTREIQKQKEEMLKTFYASTKRQLKAGTASTGSLSHPNGFLNNGSMAESKLAQTAGGQE